MNTPIQRTSEHALFRRSHYLFPRTNVLCIKPSVPIPLVHPQDDGIRPAGLPDECFYCNQKIGTPHLEDCVALKKKVRLRFLVETEVDLPYGWSEQEITNYYARDDQHWFDDLHNAALVDCSAEVIDPGPNIEIRY